MKKTWERIPIEVRPLPGMALSYSLRAFNPEIAMMIQSMGGRTPPNAYETAAGAGNSFIQAGKLAPRPAMPLLLEISTTPPSPAPTVIE